MDKSLCLFYQKIGACRHGENCSRKHVRPVASSTILLLNLYHNKGANFPKELPMDFDGFFADVFKRAARDGTVVQMVVCENENFHLNGNVYIQYASEAQAAAAVMLLNQEWYGGRPVYCELSPVENLADANCRAHDTGSCLRGDHCNFMHVRWPSLPLQRDLFRAMQKLEALRKLREVYGPDWGAQYERPLDRIERVERPAKKKKESTETDQKETKEAALPEATPTTETEPLSKTDAVARLFAV